jgi:hypothetical protein
VWIVRTTTQRQPKTGVVLLCEQKTNEIVVVLELSCALETILWMEEVATTQ